MLPQHKQILKFFAKQLPKKFLKRTQVFFSALFCVVLLPSSFIFALFSSAPGIYIVINDINEEYSNSSDKFYMAQVVSNNRTPENIFSSTTETNMKSQEYLLSVPYYIYEDEILRNNSLLNYTEIYLSQDYSWNEKFGKSGIVDRIMTFDDYLEVNRYFKHGGDIHFIRSALKHPMRTFNPEEAKLFVVPSLITKHIQEIQYATSDVKKKADEELRRLDEFLGNSEWFRRYMGRDHVAPIAYFLVNTDDARRRIPNIEKCNILQFYESERNRISYSPQRIMYPIFYVGSPCKTEGKKSSDMAFIGTMDRYRHGFKKVFKQFRKDPCEWIQKDSNYTTSVCGYGEKCPNLAKALLGLHFRGDSLSTNRLFDTILSGTVPVFTIHEQYDSVPNWYDWEQISFFADVMNRTHFMKDLRDIMQNKSNILLKTRNVLNNKDLFDWQTLVPFDVYMYKLQASLYPETKLNKSRFSALILP